MSITQEKINEMIFQLPVEEINQLIREITEALEDARDSELLRQAVQESKGQPSIIALLETGMGNGQ
jgi:hypothetical protein